MTYQCPKCRIVVALPADAAPFHCSCGAVYESLADMRATDQKPSRSIAKRKRQPVDWQVQVLDLLPEPAKIEAEAASRGVLIGDVIASMTKAVGIPPCGGCEERRQWLNRAHQWVNEWLAAPPEP